MTKTIGIIGLGSIGMRHASNLRAMGHKTVGYDPDKSKSKVCDVYLDNLDTLLETAPGIDGFVIASPTDKHLNHIIIASDRAPLFVEKPIAHNISGLPGDEWLMKNVKMVGYNLRFHSCVKRVKEWLAEDFIGRPLWANFTLGQFSEKTPYLRDGVILNWSHEIDLALYLLGEATVATSSTRLTDGKDDISDILLNHANGCRTSVHLDYVTSPEVRQFIIVGSEATIVCDLLHRHAWLRNKENVIIDHFEGHDTWQENYIEEMKAFLDRCDGMETIGCTGEEGLEVLKVCLEVRKQAGL